MKNRLLWHIILILVVCTPIVAQTPEENIAVAKSYGQALDGHDIDAILSHFVEDGIQDATVFDAPSIGHDQLRLLYEDLLGANPDWSSIDGIRLAKDEFVVVEHVSIGTNVRDAGGATWQWPHMDVFEIENGKINRLMSYGDYAGILVQFGWMPVPAAPDLIPTFPVPDAEATNLSALEADAEYVQRFNDRDLAEQAKIIDADAEIFAGPLGMTLDRNAAVALNGLFFQGFSDLSMEPVRRIDLGDGWVVLEATLQGTNDGPFMGNPPTGAPMQERMALLTQYDASGLIVYQGLYFNMLTLSMQLMPPAPELPPISERLILDEITSPALEGNLLGDPATRPMLVYLPPSYEDSADRRYPVLYLLHGFVTNHLCYDASGVNYAIQLLTGMDLGSDLAGVADGLIAAGAMDELIIVTPHAANSFSGGMYERSPLIGDYRTYIAQDLVDYIDGKYRTIADNRARGIAGQSMGGYGALSLALEYPDVFGAVAALSPALCEMEVDDAVDDVIAKYPLVQGTPVPGYTAADMWNVFLGYFEIEWLYAVAAAWTPNLDNPPFYVDLPLQYPGPTVDPVVMELWKERDLVSQVERDGANLKGKPLFVDEGRGPTLLMQEVLGVERLLTALHAQGLSYTYDAFDGDHLTGFRHQIVSALQFMSQHLDGQVDVQP